MFQCQAISAKERKKKREIKMPFRQNVVVSATFLDFQANIFPLLFKPMDRKFPIQGFEQDGSNGVLFFDQTPFLGTLGFYIS
jgi:hypothetical protein